MINVTTYVTDTAEDFPVTTITSDGTLSTALLGIATSLLGRITDGVSDFANISITAYPSNAVALPIGTSFLGRITDGASDIVGGTGSGGTLTQRWS